MEPFKNLLSSKVATEISTALKRGFPGFKENLFLKDIERELSKLELKQRVIALKMRLDLHLPKDPKRSFPVLIDALKKNEDDNIGLSGFSVWPLTHFIAENGLEHFDLSMKALYEMTQVFTGEFAIRPFFISHEERTLKQFQSWIDDPNEHIRRFVSEGSRPLLPWGQKLPSFVANPKKTWPFLEELKTDSSKYVQKSVANHINDHSKNHADWVIKQMNTWKPFHSATVHWIVKHGTRTLVKKGHAGAMLLHGVKPSVVEVTQQKLINKTVHLGEALHIEVVLKNTSNQKVKVIFDHEMMFLKSNGKLAPKVFKGKAFEMDGKEKRRLSFKIPIKKVTTRKYYFGQQLWAPIVNGKQGKAIEYQLVK